MKGFLKFVSRLCGRPKLSGWTMCAPLPVCVPVPIPYGWRFHQYELVRHVSPSGKSHLVLCSFRTGEQRYASLFRCGVN